MRLTVNKRDTQKVFAHLDKLLITVSQNAYMATKKAGDDYVNLVETGIATTRTPAFVSEEWEPLSEYWKAVKTGHTEQFWAETLGILKATRVDIIQKSLLFINIFAGIKADIDHDAFIRAVRNEYGFGLGPTRPLFEPAKDHLAPVTATGRRLNSKQHQYFILALNQAVRKVYHRN